MSEMMGDDDPYALSTPSGVETILLGFNSADRLREGQAPARPVAVDAANGGDPLVRIKSIILHDAGDLHVDRHDARSDCDRPF